MDVAHTFGYLYHLPSKVNKFRIPGKQQMTLPEESDPPFRFAASTE